MKKRILILLSLTTLVLTSCGTKIKQEGKVPSKYENTIGENQIESEEPEGEANTEEDYEEKEEQSEVTLDVPVNKGPRYCEDYYETVIPSCTEVYSTLDNYRESKLDFSAATAYLEIPKEYRNDYHLYIKNIDTNDNEEKGYEYYLTKQINGTIYVLNVENNTSYIFELAEDRDATEVNLSSANKTTMEDIYTIDHVTFMKISYETDNEINYIYQIQPSIDAYNPNDRFDPRGRFYFLPISLHSTENIDIKEFNDIAKFINVELSENYVEGIAE